jgi:hypothetical protein
LNKSEERLFFPRRQRLLRYADTGASVEVGEAEVEGNVMVFPISNSSLLCLHANKIAEFTPSRYETAHRLDVTMVIAKM